MQKVSPTMAAFFPGFLFQNVPPRLVGMFQMNASHGVQNSNISKFYARSIPQSPRLRRICTQSVG